MTAFRLTQISDTHLARRLLFVRRLRRHRADRGGIVAEVVIAGQIAAGHRQRLVQRPGEFEILAAGRTVEGEIAAVIGEDRWRFDEAGWCFIGLNSLIMNTGIESEAGQFDWLASELGRASGKPVALFIHKPLFLDTPEDPELESSAIRYVPQPRRRQLIEMFGKVDLRLIASGHVHQRRDFTYGHVRHVWAPSVAFKISEAKQELIGIKECGLVEYRFAPDSFEVRHVKAPGQVDIDLDDVLEAM